MFLVTVPAGRDRPVGQLAYLSSPVLSRATDGAAALASYLQ
jgi:hypothetical protein